MLKIENIQKAFGGVKAIQGSTFSIEPKKCTALIGPNGAGKTTLFDIIAGLIKPDTGRVMLDGKDITKMQPFTRANMGISRTFQQVRVFQYLSILDHFVLAESNADTKLFANIFKSKKVERKKYEELLRKYGIKRKLDTLASELSYGQRKLLEIAMSLQKPHSLLMLDEPVAGVNKVIQTEIEDLLLDLKKQGETMLLIDHDMEFIRKLADHVIVLDAGVVLTEGSPDKVLSDKRVLEAYLGE